MSDDKTIAVDFFAIKWLASLNLGDGIVFFDISVDYNGPRKLYAVYVDMEKAWKQGYLTLKDGEELPADRIAWMKHENDEWRVDTDDYRIAYVTLEFAIRAAFRYGHSRCIAVNRPVHRRGFRARVPERLSVCGVLILCQR